MYIIHNLQDISKIQIWLSLPVPQPILVPIFKQSGWLIGYVNTAERQIKVSVVDVKSEPLHYTVEDN